MLDCRHFDRSAILLRSVLILACLAGLSACAADPKGTAKPQIVYKGSPAPKAASSAPSKPQKSAGKSVAKASPPAKKYTAPSSAPAPATVMAPGVERPSASPVVTEARLMVPETTGRPGGPLRQPMTSLADRAVDVQRGDTLAGIARRYSVNKQALIDANKLREPYALTIGSKIYLPAPNIHVVEPGETLYSVSRRYNIDTRSLAVMSGLQQPWVVWPGDELVLPPLATVDYGAAGAPIMPARPWLTPEKSGPDTAKPVAAKPPATAAGVMPKGGFIWPVSGQVVSGFGAGDGGQHNAGVDLAAAPGASIKAAAAGQVVYAGQGVNGVGNLLLIQHSGGWITAYGQADRLLVKEGDAVAQGQSVARAGEGPGARVHFELRLGKDPVDPAERLPQPG